MTLDDGDRDIVRAELGRDLTREEAALFENLWSEHCAYRSSRPLLGAFESDGPDVVVPPGDDAGVVAIPSSDDDAADDTYLAMGIESHNHPSYVDPFDGAATGVGGIVRDILSMGAYPIALTDSLYFGDFDAEYPRYLFEGVVEGISHYGNCIGVPTVAGSVAFHDDYAGNPLVNVACVGLVDADRMVTAEAQRAGNALVLVGGETGRDGLGGASFASEDLDEDAETEDRPAVQVGDPYSEKLLIECNEALLDEGLIESARDLGAAGLGGASSELVAKGGFGADIALDRVPQREPNMSALEILLSESQERMCYEITPENVDRVAAIAERYDLVAAAIGSVTADGNFTCTFEGETAVDVPAEFLGEGAPLNDLDSERPTAPERNLPSDPPAVADAFDRLLASPNTASKRWVYRQYDHEVGVRTAERPGGDAAVLDVPEADAAIALSAGADPNWTDAAPYEGARAVGLENATNLAVAGARPHAAVDCLNGANPETPREYGRFEAIVEGLAEICADLSVPVVGGNVSLYNDSDEGPIPPTPTLAMVGVREEATAPGIDLSGEGSLLVIGDRVLAGETDPALGGSEYLAGLDGTDRVPDLPGDPAGLVDAVRDVARMDSTLAAHDASHGGLAIALAEMVTAETGASVDLTGIDAHGALFHEQAGRAIVETTAPEAVADRLAGVAPVTGLGRTTTDGRLSITTDRGVLTATADRIAERRAVIERELDG
ncbi:phosphoribosylformylglycinamidine synthase subunit PurL [Halococcoides cellulosivorans]|uniref:Phosphoribosylformylglycinamidine synthase subunit PurL n=1 Tax=Halococcoides cellulosivorans TaxID=1679096 RepID=A0A2R4X2T6_9EURY|nr:phosphoribosylformylglycinamidine synthase subunit PurL [Halococcoides cellulosivorans]AWB28105.1 phosphoribosylformylglycinamidine synthase subunit PurL [Halococcoides cellulosivorans]